MRVSSRFLTANESSVYRIYKVWVAYAMLVAEAFYAYCRRTEHWPVIVSLGVLFVSQLVLTALGVVVVAYNDWPAAGVALWNRGLAVLRL